MRPTRHRRTLALVLVTALGALAGERTNEVVQLDTMVVTATRTAVDYNDAPASLSVVDHAQIEARPMLRVGDVLHETPSLYLWGNSSGQYPPTSVGGRMSLRGIPGNARTLVLLDHQALNDPYLGNVNWSSIFPEDVDRIEVLAGPGSALYGGHAFAGVVHVLSRQPTHRELSIRGGVQAGNLDGGYGSILYRDRLTNGFGLSVGYRYESSQGYPDIWVVKTPTGRPAGTNVVDGAAPTITPDGRPAYQVGDRGRRPWETSNAQVKFYQDLTEATQLNGGVVLSQADVTPDPYDTFLVNGAGQPVAAGDLNIDGDQVLLAESEFINSVMQEQFVRGFVNFEHELSEDAALQAGGSFTDFQNSFQMPGRGATLERGPGTLTDAPTQVADGYLQGSFRLGDSQLWTGGFNFNQGTLHRTAGLLRDWRDRASLTQANSYLEGQNTTYAWFLQDEIRLLERVTVYAGARVDWWSTEGRETLLGTNVVDYPYRSEVEVSPRLALVGDTWKGGVVRAAVGRAFRPPTLFDLYVSSERPTSIAFGNPDLNPETVLGWELGVQQTVAPTRTTLRATYFDNYLNDMIYAQTLTSGPPVSVSRRVNAGEAIARGVEVGVGQGLTDWLQLDLTYTYTYTRVTENEADPASVGKRLTNTPEDLFSGSLQADWHRWSGSLVGRFVDSSFDTSDNSDVIHDVYGGFERHWVVDLKVSYRPTAWATISLSALNLLDTEYFQYIPNPGRSWLTEVAFRF